jgi:hypothetical protein
MPPKSFIRQLEEKNMPQQLKKVYLSEESKPLHDNKSFQNLLFLVIINLMTSFAQKLAAFLIALGIFSVLAACLFGASPAFSMDMDQHGNMDGCVFTGKTALCNMSVTEHISRWQNLFTAIPQKTLDVLFLG